MRRGFTSAPSGRLEAADEQPRRLRDGKPICSRDDVAIARCAVKVSRWELAAVRDQQEILCGTGQRRAGAERPVEVVGAQFDVVEVGPEERECPGGDVLQEET